MRHRLARRLAKINDGRQTLAPCILAVRFDETREEALSRFAKQWPDRPAGYGLLIVPAKPRTETEEEVWETRFFENQQKLISEVRSSNSGNR